MRFRYNTYWYISDLVRRRLQMAGRANRVGGTQWSVLGVWEQRQRVKG